MLLGVLGGQMFIVAINKYDLAIDQLSFYFTMYNFAIVGSIAVFYQKGIPTYINQGYLIATSVIVSCKCECCAKLNQCCIATDTFVFFPISNNAGNSVSLLLPDLCLFHSTSHQAHAIVVIPSAIREFVIYLMHKYQPNFNYQMEGACFGVLSASLL